MRLSLKLAILISSLILFASSTASAGEEACGKFDFSGGLNCKIEVSGGCSAKCTPISFEAGCNGGCTAEPDPGCVDDDCGEACILECNPELLDCFAGCHSECDADVQAECEAADPTKTDCAIQAKSQCNGHCEAACEVPPSDCKEHCNKCCFGSCQTLKNFQCDFDCYAEFKGGCDVSCQQPEGAIFCNGQFVNATDIGECINYLLTQGIEVDVSATASVECGPEGCDFAAAVEGAGCSFVAPGNGETEMVLLLGLFGLGLIVVRQRRLRK